MKKVFSEISRYLFLTLGSAIYALAIAIFLNPLSLAPGGISGISIIVNTISGFPTGTLILCINIPLMAISFFKFGKRFFFSTAYVTIITSLAIDGIAKLSNNQPIITQNLLLACIAGGAGVALGIGIVLRAGGTTGGSDIVIKLLRQKYRHLNTGTIFFCFDLCVIAASSIVFKNIEIALYALIAVFVASKVLDFVLYGLEKNKLVYIISDESEPIAKRLIKELDLGVTYVDGEGAYTGKEKRILLCAVRNQVFPKLKKTVKEEDPTAFLIVSDATSIFGEGYKAIDKEDL